MITSSFILLDKIGEKQEHNIWKQGIKSWSQFLAAKEILGISKERKLFYDTQLRNASEALKQNDSSYFVGRLPSNQVWRLYDYFRDETVFLDIETNGVGQRAELTVVGLYDGRQTKTMIKGVNLDDKKLQEELSHYKLLVTFNGSSFDVPFLLKRYPNLLPVIPHLDVRHTCAALGLTGGLKKIEQQLGIRRRELIEKIGGGDAFLLWRMYRATGDDYYLKLLVEYNEEDVINLQELADYVYEEMEKKDNWTILGLSLHNP